MIFSSVDTAAPDACCSRATDWENAARRAFRYAASNSGSFTQRKSVLGAVFPHG
jgi:hypothetical protein